jgi:hypothetical protein
MKNGTKVKVISRDYPRFGEVGEIVGKEMTPFGMAYRIEFEDGIGLYTWDKIKEI